MEPPPPAVNILDCRLSFSLISKTWAEKSGGKQVLMAAQASSWSITVLKTLKGAKLATLAQLINLFGMHMQNVCMLFKH